MTRMFSPGSGAQVGYRRAPKPPQRFSERLRFFLDHTAEHHPARFTIGIFTSLIALLTSILLLPAATAAGNSTSFADALFTAVSAICVTGLTTVDMGSHWSAFGNTAIMIGLQVGGVGVLTAASLLGLLVSRRLGLTQRLLAAGDTNPLRTHHGPVAERQAVRLGDIKGLLRAVLLTVVIIELSLLLLIYPRILLEGTAPITALWHSFYFAASAFTNTGFVPTTEGMAPFSTDTYMLTVLGVGVFLGSLGFPVMYAVYRYRHLHRWRRPSRLPLHTKLTLLTTLLLLLIGALLIGLFEWGNPGTLGSMGAGHRIQSSMFLSTMSRSGGLANVDVSAMHEHTLLLIDMLMFVGGGSASTAGGIKVTTLAVLFLAAFAEARGFQDVNAFGRRIPQEVLRLAVSVVLWAATCVAFTTLILLQLTEAPFAFVLFDVISAFGTCGLSTGVAESLPDSGKIVLAATMWAGRIGTVTLAAALATKTRTALVRNPEERPIVG